MVQRYQSRISGPLMDRIDIHVEVPRIEFEKLTDQRAGELSVTVRKRVETARKLQRERFEGTHLATTSDMGPGEIQEFCQVDKTGEGLLKAAMAQFHLSPRAHHRILKLARTIADLNGSEGIESVHLAEAIQYRPRQMA